MDPIPAASPPAGPPADAAARGGSGGTAGRRLRAVLPFVPALVPAAVLVAIAYSLLTVSASGRIGLGVLGWTWNPAQGHWGIGLYVVGSFLTAIPALFLSLAIGIGIAIASTTYLPRWSARLLDPFVDLLAGIPSVVYGIWAYYAVGPLFQDQLNPWIAGHFGFVPGFAGPVPSTGGQGIPLAIFLLTLMALPITTLLVRDALRAVPVDLWESGLALGATRWEVTRRVAIPYAARGIASAAFLGFGRAFGETVAVAMVLGTASKFPDSFYSTGNTMAAQMFVILDSAYGNSQYLAALAEMGLVLLAIALVVNLLGRRLIASLSRGEIAGI